MDLYQELILEHSKNPLHTGLREPFDGEVHHVNPTCGDEVTLRVSLGDGVGQSGAEAADPVGRVVADVSYQAIGCSISVASSSMLADLVIGRPVAQAMTVVDAMGAMLTSRGTDLGDEDIIGDGVALAGVAKYPARVKCALLGWTAFVDALVRADVPVTMTKELRR